MQRSGSSSGIKASHHEFVEGLHRSGIVLHGVIGQASVGSGGVCSHSSYLATNGAECFLKLSYWISTIATTEITNPCIILYSSLVVFILRPEPAIQQSPGNRFGFKVVLTIVSEHVGVLLNSVEQLSIRIHEIDHLSPGIDVFPISGQ